MACSRRLTADGRLLAAVVLLAGCGDRRADEASRAADSASAVLRADSAPTPAFEPDSTVAIIFAASLRESGSYLVPIAFLTARRQLLDVPVGQTGDPGFDAFAARWALHGQRYRLFRNGEEIGAITATRDSTFESVCAGLAAPARPDSGIHYTKDAEGIATDLQDVRSHRTERRDVTDDEVTVLQRLAPLAIPDSVPANLRNVSFLAADAVRLSDQPHPALIARFRASSAGTDQFFDLLLIAEHSGGAYVTTFTLSNLALDAESSGSYELLDAFDYNTDGIMDLVIANSGYESISYSILTRDGPRWVMVYSGGGGGC